VGAESHANKDKKFKIETEVEVPYGVRLFSKWASSSISAMDKCKKLPCL